MRSYWLIHETSSLADGLVQNTCLITLAQISNLFTDLNTILTNFETIYNFKLSLLKNKELSSYILTTQIMYIFLTKKNYMEFMGEWQIWLSCKIVSRIEGLIWLDINIEKWLSKYKNYYVNNNYISYGIILKKSGLIKIEEKRYWWGY